ncbi:MAG: DUF1292 domain-containing protein [Lachnospiraceae bacterium]|jgi:hypothetical protein|nr:DUF1292 domain-containing protein [Lachnospiraceae bacterium]MBR0435350.1 DUF1292 domain-containing protein [Lachnospiraceae bacterium]MCR4750356.1 DUF1292 domain-containing protein [Lachnospiraceae bacterium]
MEKINFFNSETNEDVEFYVVCDTKFQGGTYLLVTEEEDGDSDAYILREVKEENDGDLFYEMVDDDALLDALGNIFSELLDDVDVR